MPPLDPTAPASVRRIPVRVSNVRPIAKPILASECLKDDIAPLEPFARTARGVLVCAGIVAIAGAAVLFKEFPNAAISGFSGGALMAVAAALPNYRLRAAFGGIGAASTVVTILAGEPSWAFRAIAAIVLAAALFTRAGYRAHRGVRVALAVGIVAFAGAAVTSFGGHLPSRIAAGAMAAIAAASLLGFMGEQTTGGSAFWGALALLTAGASIAVAVPFALVPWAAALTLLSASVAASVAIFALAASIIAPGERAREHKPSLPAPSPESERDDD